MSNNRRFWIGIGITIIVTIIAIISFSVLVLVLNNNSNVGLNGECNDSKSCGDGLACVNGFCKSEIGNSCQVLKDCIPNATVCLNNICSDQRLGGPGERPPCQKGLLINNGICVSRVGGVCRNDTQCVVGSRCNEGVCVNQLGGVGDPEPCQRGLVVSEGICKLPDGDCCVTNDQCVSGSLCDIETEGNNISQNGICTPIPKTGEMCTPIADLCGMGDICGKSVVLNTFGDNLYPEVDEPIIDLTQILSNQVPDKRSKSYSYNHHHPGDLGEVVLLLQDGNFILSNKGRLKFIQSDIAMKRVIAFNGDIFAVSSGLRIKNTSIQTPEEGILYILKNGSKRNMRWKWEIQSWAPNNITHFSVTNNGQYFWLQSIPILNTPDTQGFLYRLRTQEEIDNGLTGPVLVQKDILRDYAIRNYGNTILSYIQFSPVTGDAILYPRKLVLKNIFYAILLLDGSLFSIGKSDKNKLMLTRTINSAGVYITHRLCQPNDC